MAIFVDLKDNPDLLRRVKEAHIYQQHFSTAPLPHQLHLARNHLGLDIEVKSRSGKHIIRGAWNCFIGLSVEEGDETTYIVDAEESSDPSTAPPRYYGLRQQVPL